jgi:LuxR family transcriptional regulator, quorum-sensing system regulator SdiA
LRFRNILHFLVAIGEVPTRETLTAEVEQLLHSYGFKYYCVFHQPKPIENASELIMVANWPASWLARYVERKYIVVDPAIRYLMRANRSFSWDEAIEAYRGNPHFQRMKKMMADGKANGMASGFVFPVFSRVGLIGATTIGGPDNVELSPAEIALLETAFRNAYFKYLEFMGAEYADLVSEGIEITMTHREMQALHNLAEGRTSPEIASVLDVSPNTVDWYVTSLQSKLRARNRNHAVALAFRMGLIS